MQPPSNRSPRGKFPSIREKNREFCKFEGVATTCARTNARRFRRFVAKFPVRIEPGILLSNRELFFSNREIRVRKREVGGRTRFTSVCLAEKSARPQLKASPYVLEEKGGNRSLAGSCQVQTKTRIPNH